MKSLSLLSKYRTELMGIAMLLVFFSHLPIPIKNTILFFFQWNGHFGVDIFVLLSGMGLYYSFVKDNNLKSFYSKRLLRILPIYIIINLSYLMVPGFIPHMSLWEIIATCTTIGYWFNYGYCDWFIPHLMLMYLFFPIFNLIVKRTDYQVSVTFLCAGWAIVSFVPILDDHFYRASFRWIVFVMGIIIGKLINESKDEKQLHIIVQISILLSLIGVFVSIFFFLKYSDLSIGVFEQPLYKKGYIYLPYIMIVTGFCYMLCVLFERIKMYGECNLIMGGGKNDWTDELRNISYSHLFDSLFLLYV